MRYPKLRELKEALKALIKGPYTSKFPFKPHVPFERFREGLIFTKRIVWDALPVLKCARLVP